MADKDPKDMTASELLRWAANGKEDENGSNAFSTKLIFAITGKDYITTTEGEDNAAVNALADQIDAEIEAARMDARNMSFWAGLDARIALFDYPCRKNETLDEWIERCFIQRPLDENGEPVQFGDDDIDWDETSECRAPGAWWNATAVDCRGMLLATEFSNIYAVAKTDESGRVKRRAPEALGADGLPIVEGETVYPIDGDWIGDPLEVASIDRDGSVIVSLSEGKGWTSYLADRLTHTPPDTQERIDEDAQKSSHDYWGCTGVECDGCRRAIDGKKPYEYFDCLNCLIAKTLDLLRRQRELDSRKGGGR